MVALPFSKLPPEQAWYLIEMQRHYSPEQREMAIASPHMVWLTPKNRTLRKALRLSVWERGDGACAYCRAPLTAKTFTVDHIRPVANGGSDDLGNLTVACGSCNSSKGARTLAERDG